MFFNSRTISKIESVDAKRSGIKITNKSCAPNNRSKSKKSQRRPNTVQNANNKKKVNNTNVKVNRVNNTKVNSQSSKIGICISKLKSFFSSVKVNPETVKKFWGKTKHYTFIAFAVLNVLKDLFVGLFNYYKVKVLPSLVKFVQFVKKFEYEIILCVLCLVGVCISLLNPLWFNNAPVGAGSMYAVIGKLLAYGDVLYRDMIDVKGPGLFFLNMIGYRLGGYIGIAFIETVFFLFGLISIDLALRIFRFSPLARLCSILVVISLLGFRYYTGNITENYTLYLTMISSYPLALLFALRRFRWSLSIIPALAFAYTLSIRINNCAFFLAWYIMLFLMYAYNGRLVDSFKLIISALIGIAVLGTAFGLYFYNKGGIELCYEAMFYSFLVYFQEGGIATHDMQFILGSAGFWRTGLFIVIIGYMLLLNKKDNRLVSIAEYRDRYWIFLYLLLGIVFTAIANSFTGHIFNKYDILYLPFMFLPLAFLMNRYLHIKRDIHISFITVLGLVVFLVIEHLIWDWQDFEWNIIEVMKHVSIDFLIALVICSVLFIVRWKLGTFYHNHPIFLCMTLSLALIICCYALALGPSKGLPDSNDERINVEVIKNNTTVFDKIWVDGNKPEYYIWTDRLPVSPYLYRYYQTPNYNIQEKVNENLNYFKPKYILLAEFEERDKYLKAHEMESERSRRSEVIFFKFLFSNYKEVNKGLYVINNSMSSIVDDSLDWVIRLKGENEEVGE